VIHSVNDVSKGYDAHIMHQISARSSVVKFELGLCYGGTDESWVAQICEMANKVSYLLRI
jgi:hypothetical protein